MTSKKMTSGTNLNGMVKSGTSNLYGTEMASLGGTHLSSLKVLRTSKMRSNMQTEKILKDVGFWSTSNVGEPFLAGNLENSVEEWGPVVQTTKVVEVTGEEMTTVIAAEGTNTETATTVIENEVVEDVVQGQGTEVDESDDGRKQARSLRKHTRKIHPRNFHFDAAENPRNPNVT